MSFEKFFNWWVTHSGRRAASYIATGVIASVGASHLLPQTLFIDNYVDFLHLYRKGFTVPLSNETKNKFEKVMEVLKVPPEKRPYYKPFNIVGFDVVSIGASFSRWGIRVGIPANFGYSDETDIEKHRITLNGQNVLWETEAGQKLLKSLVLSENAQFYAIAREIRMREQPKLLINVVIGTSSAFATYALSKSINSKFNLYAKPAIIRIAMYMLVTCFNVGNYFLVKDLSQLHFEQTNDKELKEKYPNLAEGAKEYYTKLLLRNMCLRVLLGKDGESLYSPLGNENYFIRMRSTPLMQRREFFD